MLIYLAFLVTGLVAATAPIVGLVVAVPVFIGGLWIGLAAAVRRLHDRNKSGWWLLPMFLPSILLSALAEGAATSAPELGMFLRLLGIPFSIWVFVELGCLKGTDGANRFGHDPLKRELTEVFS